MQIFLDIDDVLVDFRAGACRVWGWNRGEVDRRANGSWCMADAMGIGQREFMDRILLEGPAFWAELPPMPYAADLLQVVNRYATELHLITAPQPCPGCYAGKAEWVKSYFGPDMLARFHPVVNKALMAKPGRILIDDGPHNVDSWTGEGGYGILFPALHNNRANLILKGGSPVAYVQETLRILSSREPSQWPSL